MKRITKVVRIWKEDDKIGRSVGQIGIQFHSDHGPQKP